jgi:ketosteroid isomerase-like protein
MKNLFCAFLTGASLFFFSCSNAPKVNPDTELQSLRQADKNWSDAASAKDAKRYMEFYDKEGTVIDLDGHVTRDMEAVLKSVNDQFSIPGYSLVWINKNAVVAKAGDLGYTSGNWTMQWNNEKGEQEKAQGPYLVIWKKQADGSWKAIVDSYWKAQ